MQQLSEHDAAFLASDTAHANANVSLLHIYDQSTAPQGLVRFKTILAHIQGRLGASPVFRRRLMTLPLAVDRPYWVDDENFDLEYHVRHIALPKPGDWRQFCIQVSRIHARPLDLNRPLWEIYVIEGLDSFLDLPAGSFALMIKTHHAAVDIAHEGELSTLLHDLSPEAAAPPPPAPWFPDSAPAVLPLVTRGVWRRLVAPRKLLGPLAQHLRRFTPAPLALAGEALLGKGPAPLVRFNAVVSPHRVFETRRFGIDEFKRIRGLVPGATVHDAVLAVCGGALRRYLDGHDELPAQGLLALAPVWVRGRADSCAPRGAELEWLQVDLATDVDDPVDRLRRIQAQTSGSEPMSRAVGAREQSAGAARGAASVITRAARGVARALTAGRTPGVACSITNVPGPDQPMYLCGARMSYFSAMLPISDGLGLAFAVTSYDGRLVISPTSCRELMPDPERFALCLREAFQDLLARATLPVRRRRAAVKPAPRPTPAAAPAPRPNVPRAPRARAGTR